ncbi:hypothetical protein AX16_010762 [Volvariella volvacea WC 439]|nr:hypothetical protein AX16_010762 [Volvariella volvacea WC 439]
MAYFCNKYVPQELLDTIVSHLSHDKHALKTCSLISSRFTEPSQRQFFRQMSLTLHSDIGIFILDIVIYHHIQANSKYFQAMLSSLSVQFEYVRELQLRIAFCGPSTPLLIKIIDRLVNLRQLNLDLKDCRFEEVDRELLSRCFRLPLAHFHIKNAKGFPEDHFHSCTSIIQLSLTSSTIFQEKRIDDAKSPKPSAITVGSLFLDGSFSDFAT